MRFVANPKFAQEIQRQVEFKAEMVRVGEKVVQEAKAIAPVGKRMATPDSPHYRDTISLLTLGPKVYVRTTDFAGHMVEWGSVNNIIYAVIRRAVIQSGLRLDEAQRNRLGQPDFNAVIRGV